MKNLANFSRSKVRLKRGLNLPKNRGRLHLGPFDRPSFFFHFSRSSTAEPKMLRLLCFIAVVAFVAASERPTLSEGKYFKVQKQADVRVTDMDRMVFQNVYEIEQKNPDYLHSTVEWSRVQEILRSTLGEDWEEKVDVDSSAGELTQLELLRLSARISNYNVEHASRSRDYKTNLCMCHGTSKYPSAGGNSEGSGWYYYGVRIMSPEGHETSRVGPNDAPHDCLLCDGQFNCLACCHGVCITDGLPAGPPGSWGLYNCFTCDEDTCANSIAGCHNNVEDCASALALCTSCYERIQVLKLVNCDCAGVVELCTSCYDAWDAIDKYKKCSCKDYAYHYQFASEEE